jgi:hypothetical protein
MGVKELSDKGPDGTRLGQSAADLVAFYGVAPVAQPAVLAAVTTAASSVTAFGFATTAQFDNLIAAVNSIISKMKTLGLMATS